MLVDIDPIIFQIGPFAPRWYGLGYVLGILISLYLMGILTEKKVSPLTKDQNPMVLSVMFFVMLIFSRLTYVVVYNWEFYRNNISEAPMFWLGGLSYHGAIVGLALGLFLCSHFMKKPYSKLLDVCTLAMAPSVFFGRIGNFINGELYGRVTDLPFGMIFPSGGMVTRHPSQLYEAVAEGLILPIILWLLYKKSKIQGSMIAFYLMGYGIARFIIEFFREPDSQVGYVLGFFTMGQVLCTGMIIVGAIMYMWMRSKESLRHS